MVRQSWVWEGRWSLGVTEKVWLPAAAKASTRGAGADVKESGLFADAGHLEDGALMSQSPSPGRWGTHLTKPISTSQ